MKLKILLSVVALTLATNLSAQPSGMVLIPAGSFTMGNCMDTNEGLPSELPLHTVYVSAFYMDKNLVTLTLWSTVYQWASSNGYSFDNLGLGKATNQPVETVNWYDIIKWCNARSEMEGLTPCYYTNANLTGLYRSGDLDLSNSWVNWRANGYRLPTEAEWEKAARGGISGHRFPWGDNISWGQANYYANPSSYAYDVNPTAGVNPLFATLSPPYTSPVGYFAPNGYGLYDMAGNIFEWCWDWQDNTWYGTTGATQNDSRGPVSSPNDYHVLRGGSWHDGAPFWTRCADRFYDVPYDANSWVGFRCVGFAQDNTNLATSLNNGLVAYYPFNGNANDASGNGNNGIVMGTVLTTNRFGTPNSAYYFPGNNDWISVPDAPSLDLTNGYTLSAWINFEAGGTGAPRIADKFMYSFYTYLNGSARSLGMYFSDQTSLTTATNYYAGQWYFVASSYDLHQRKIYVNGNLVAYDSCTFALITNSLPLEIGRKPVYGYDNFEGIIDDVRVYNRALSDSEVQELYSLADAGPLTVVQTNRAPTTNEIGQPTIPTDLTHFKVFTNGTFQSGIPLDPTRMTVVMTHGWKSSPNDWATNMATLILNHVPGTTPNIVAWDWSQEANNPNLVIPSFLTQGEGRALGQDLLQSLGANYSMPIHFIGHSLGTLVNGAAADYIHGDAPNSSGTFDPQNTQMTLFDEAELAPEIFNALVALQNHQQVAPPFYYTPIPMRAAWIDNYISAFGLPHPEAANVILTDGAIFNASDLNNFISGITAFHGYPCLWYDDSVSNSSGSLMGYRWSFEQNGLTPPPATDTMFVQTPGSSELNLQQTTFDNGVGVLVARFPLYVAEPGITGVATAINNVVQAVGQVTGAIDNAGNMIVNLFTSIGNLPLVQSSARPLGEPVPNGGSANNNTPAYAWIPLAVPSNVISMSFDFMLQGNGNNDSFQAALNGTNVLSLETVLIQTNVTLNSGLIDVSQYAGTNVELFLGIVGGTSTNAQLTVSDLQFYSAALPSLQAQPGGGNLMLSWPLSAQNFSLQTTTNLADPNSWVTLTNVPAIVNLQNAVTNPVFGGAQFYRLVK